MMNILTEKENHQNKETKMIENIVKRERRKKSILESIFINWNKTVE